MSDSQDFPFGIADVAELLHLQMRRHHSVGGYYDCPFCGDKRGKMSINTEKNVWRCNYCGEYGGMLSLYARLNHISNSDAFREISDALLNGELGDSFYSPTPIKAQVSVTESELASIDVLHKTYSALLDVLTLSPAHREHLHNVRGLTDEQIESFGYKSTPSFYNCKRIAKRLQDMGCTLEGVPGFYKKDGIWTVKFYTKATGILIPVKGVDGLIRGMQIRLDVPLKDENDSEDKSGTKYIWLSSAGKDSGVSSGAPVHFVGDPFVRTVFITEGILKADIAHTLMNRSFIAIAGIGNTSRLEIMFNTLKANGTRVIIEAADMDKFRNENVSHGVSKIYRIAKECGLEFRRLTWNPNYKGIDDWQLALKKKQTEKEVCTMNFKTRFIYGFCEYSEIDRIIAEWSEKQPKDKSLAEHLGFTEQEYSTFLQADDEVFRNDLLKSRREQSYRIYQLDFGDGKPKTFAFDGINALYGAGYTQPPASEYALVHDDKLFCLKNDNDDTCLELIWSRFWDSLPEGYIGRNLAPSDVVELYDENGRRYFYRDKDGFCEVKFSPLLAKKIKR